MPEAATVDLRDTWSFGAFYDETLPTVYGYFFGRCGGDRMVAEDLTQETFLAGVRELRRGVEVASPRPWIMGIARHKLVDHYRSRARDRRRRDAAEAEELVDAPLEWDCDDVGEDAIAALAEVPASQRLALVLRYVDDLPVTQVARTLGKSEHATESLLARGRASFRRAFQGGEPCQR